MENIIALAKANPVVTAVALGIMADTVFGVLRSCKEHGFNSSFGIDGGIRKVGMIFSMMFLLLADYIVDVNLAFFLPNEWLKTIGLTRVGLAEFFGILFTLYECISILKNMILIGLPIPKRIKEKIEEFLYTMTDEMPKEKKDNEEEK